jgi:hypothetical protein
MRDGVLNQDTFAVINENFTINRHLMLKYTGLFYGT